MNRTNAENTTVVNEAIRLAAAVVGAKVADMDGYYAAGAFAAEPSDAESLAAELVECWNEQKAEWSR